MTRADHRSDSDARFDRRPTVSTSGGTTPAGRNSAGAGSGGGSVPRIDRRTALRLGGSAASALLAGCGGRESADAFEDSAGTATLEIVGANMEPRGVTAYVRVRRTHVPVCRYATPSCEQSATEQRLLRDGYHLSADEVRGLADLSVELRGEHVASSRSRYAPNRSRSGRRLSRGPTA